MSDKILVLEDRGDYQIILRNLLNSQGYSVKVCSTVQEAKATLGRSAYILAIVDISMVMGDQHDEQGIELLKEIIEKYYNDPMNSIVLTAYGNVKRTRDAFKIFNVFDYVEKGSDEKNEIATIVKRVKDGIADAKSRFSERKYFEKSLYDQLAAILCSDEIQRSSLSGQIQHLIEHTLDSYAPLTLVEKDMDVPHEEGGRVLFTCWSREKEKMILVQIARIPIDLSGEKWVRDRSWNLTTLTAPIKAREVGAWCFVLDGVEYENAF